VNRYPRVNTGIVAFPANGRTLRSVFATSPAPAIPASSPTINKGRKNTSST
jgi:hypothetical protein